MKKKIKQRLEALERRVAHLEVRHLVLHRVEQPLPDDYEEVKRYSDAVWCGPDGV